MNASAWCVACSRPSGTDAEGRCLLCGHAYTGQLNIVAPEASQEVTEPSAPPSEPVIPVLTDAVPDGSV